MAKEAKKTGKAKRNTGTSVPRIKPKAPRATLNERITAAIAAGFSALPEQQPKVEPKLEPKVEPAAAKASGTHWIDSPSAALAVFGIALLFFIGVGLDKGWFKDLSLTNLNRPSAGTTFQTPFANKKSVARDIVANADVSTLDITSDPCTLSTGVPGLVAKVKATDEMRCVKKN